MTIGQDIDEMVQKLKQQRDELKLQAHLFRADANDEWEKAEKRWTHFQARSKQVGDAAGDAGEGIAEAARGLGREILAGYDRIRKTL
jgi:hypothetical protein